jgi:carbonic anhydrase
VKKLIEGYQKFRQKYATGDDSVMQTLSQYGQRPEIMIISCCDSRVDPAVLLQCDPGKLFVVRNIANIIPPYEKDEKHHGTSAALEFAVRFLHIKNLIILGHSKCGGIQALLSQCNLYQNDFITNWVSLIENEKNKHTDVDSYAKKAVLQSYEHALEFPWIKKQVDAELLTIHRWFFDIATGTISAFCDTENIYKEL